MNHLTIAAYILSIFGFGIISVHWIETGKCSLLGISMFIVGIIIFIIT